jgi:hypothetical protein
MSEKQRITHPSWALACKRKGSELRYIRGNYYLYAVTSKWNPDKKRSVKITGRLLGKITEADGFIESEKARLRKQQLVVERVHVKEYGVCAIIESLFCDTVEMLKKHFPDSWQTIICLAFGRLVYRSALKNMLFHYRVFTYTQYSADISNGTFRGATAAVAPNRKLYADLSVNSSPIPPNISYFCETFILPFFHRLMK